MLPSSWVPVLPSFDDSDKSTEYPTLEQSLRMKLVAVTWQAPQGDRGILAETTPRAFGGPVPAVAAGSPTLAAHGVITLERFAGEVERLPLHDQAGVSWLRSPPVEKVEGFDNAAELHAGLTLEGLPVCGE